MHTDPHGSIEDLSWRILGDRGDECGALHGKAAAKTVRLHYRTTDISLSNSRDLL